MKPASLHRQLNELLQRADAEGIEALKVEAAARWYSRVSELRKQWLSEPSEKTRKQYAKLYELLTRGDSPAEPGELLKRAAERTASKQTLRAYRAAIKYMETRKAVAALRAVLDQADDEREAAVKAVEVNRLVKAASGLVHLVIYDKALPKIEAELLSVVESIDSAKVVSKPSGVRKERSHRQRQKLSKLPDDWMARMLTRMSKGRGEQPGKYALHTAACLLTGARPEEMNGMTIRRDGSRLVITANGAKHSKTRGAIAATTGRKTRSWTLTPEKLDPQRAAAFAKLDAAMGSDALTLGDGQKFADAWRKASANEFGERAVSVYASRHQFASDLKASMAGLQGKALEAAQMKLADAMGHASTATQTLYGRARLSRLNGVELGIEVSASGVARVVNKKPKGDGGFGGGVKPSPPPPQIKVSQVSRPRGPR